MKRSAASKITVANIESDRQNSTEQGRLDECAQRAKSSQTKFRLRDRLWVTNLESKPGKIYRIKPLHTETGADAASEKDRNRDLLWQQRIGGSKRKLTPVKSISTKNQCLLRAKSPNRKIASYSTP